MSSKIIKFVAGGGKTTYSESILKEKSNGLYLAFTNSVVETLFNKGYVSKTIDSLFCSFLLPKFFPLIPLVSKECEKIHIVLNNSRTKNSKNNNSLDNNQNTQTNLIGNMHIKSDGFIYNKSKNTGFNLSMTNDELQSMSNMTNLKAVQYIFSKSELKLNNTLAEDLYSFILIKYRELIIKLLKNRFDYIIIDEAQDLKGFREEFAKILYESDIELFVLGDDNQNVNCGGDWFESLEPNCTCKKSYRCPEQNCKWIRDNIGIEIYGNDSKVKICKIIDSDISKLNNGERVLLYCQNKGKAKKVLDNWKGPFDTIRSAKGSTIEKDIVIVAETINKKNLYTGITRTTKNCYLLYDKIN